MRYIGRVSVLVLATLACQGEDAGPTTAMQADGVPEVLTEPDYAECVFGGTLETSVPWSATCDNLECAQSDAAGEIVSLVQAELARNGVAQYYRFIRANEVVGTTQVELAFVVTLDWFQSAFAARLPLNVDATTIATKVETNFCLQFPDEIIPYAKLLDALLVCDPEATYDPCRNAHTIHNGCSPLGAGKKQRPPTNVTASCYTDNSTFALIDVSTEELECSRGGMVCQ